MTDILLMSLVGLIGGFVGSQAGAGSLITLPALLFLGLPPALAVGERESFATKKHFHLE